jgi:hypothetical protein
MRGSGCEQHGVRDLLEMPDRDSQIAVPGERDLALLRDLEPAGHRRRGLPQDRAVRPAAAATERAASPVEQGELDVVALGPRRQIGLRPVQGKVRREHADVLRGVRVAEHRLEPACAFVETPSHARQSDQLIEDHRRAFQIRARLEQRDDVDRQRAVGDGDPRERVDAHDVGHRVREAHDVPPAGMGAEAPLNVGHRAERLQNLTRSLRRRFLANR